MIAIAGGKGGCGKTTTTVGLARALVAAGRRPIVVDADVDMPDLHQVTDVNGTPGLGALGEGQSPQDLLQPSPAVRGVSVLAAGDARPPLTGAFNQLAATSRPVLVDCPAGASPDAAAPLRHADASVPVATDTAAGLAAATKTAAMAKALAAPPKVGVIRGEVPQDRARSALDCDRVITVPDVDAPLTHPGVRANWSKLAQLIART